MGCRGHGAGVELRYFHGMSSMAFKIISTVAVLVIVATTVGIFLAGRVPPDLQGAQPQTPTPEETGDLPPFFTDEEAQSMLADVMEAGLSKKPEDLVFLAECLGDRRQIPAPPEPEKTDKEKEDAKSGAEGDPPRPKPMIDLPKTVSVSSVAQGWLATSGMPAVPPVMSRMRKLLGECTDPKQPLTLKELRVLKDGLVVLSEIQRKLLNDLKKAGKPMPADPPIMVMAKSKLVDSIPVAGGAQVREMTQEREFPLAWVLVTDPSIATAATQGSWVRGPTYEVSRDNIGKALDAVEVDTKKLDEVLQK